MEIEKRFIFSDCKPRNYCRLSDEAIEGRPKFIVIRHTQCPGATAEQVAESMKRRGEVSVHYIVDDEKVLQCVEDGCVAHHCGGAKASNKCAACNQNAIGIAIVENKINHESRSAADLDWFVSNSTFDNAVELVADLMERYEIPSEKVIRLYDVNGKSSPRPFVGSEINRFYGVSGDEIWAHFKRETINKLCLEAAKKVRKGES